MNIKNILKITIEKNASDLHLTVGLPPAIRIDGSLVVIEGEGNVTAKEMEQAVFSLLTAEQKAIFLQDLDLDFGYEVDKSRFRVNILFERGNIGLVARLIDDEKVSLDEIGMPKVTYDLLDLKQGLILVTGPTGCGKSTTLAAMINHINDNRSENIITLEDPIEYVFTPNKSIIMQRQLGRDMSTFQNGLKHALRQDPNVIMVGEMRDLETIASTITLAETGHLVLATLHTYSAAQTIDRIIDIFPPHQQNQIRSQLSTTLKAVISQRLLPKINGGRAAAREIMLNTPAVANLIRENKITQLKTVIETNKKEGMISLDQDIKRIYEEGLVDKDTARAQMTNPESIK